MTVTLAAAFALDEQVSLRPEPFGALAYHYGNRRLIFLRSPDIVRVVSALADQPTVEAALTASAIEKHRWPTFVSALNNLENSEVIHAR